MQSPLTRVLEGIRTFGDPKKEALVAKLAAKKTKNRKEKRALKRAQSQLPKKKGASTKSKRGRGMSKKLKNVKISPKVRLHVRHMYRSWNAMFEPLTGRQGPRYPNCLHSDTMPIPQNSLTHIMAMWAEQQGERFDDTWQDVLNRIPRCDIFKKGYGNLTAPNLAWLFEPDGGCMRIEQVLGGKYEMRQRSGYQDSANLHGV